MQNRVYFLCEKNNDLHYFHFEQVDASSALNESYALRHQVYCTERGFLPASAYPSGLEIDEYDQCSSHFAGFHKAGGMAGTVRLIETPFEQLPLSKKCIVDKDSLPSGIRKDNIGEISRLAVSKTFRRRIVDGILPDIKDSAGIESSAPAQRRRNCPELVLGIYKILYHHSRQKGIDYWFAAMESSLAKLLNRFHFEFRPIGPEIDYYGPVRPYIAVLSELERNVHAQSPELFWSFMDGLDKELLPPTARK